MMIGGLFNIELCCVDFPGDVNEYWQRRCTRDDSGYSCPTRAI